MKSCITQTACFVQFWHAGGLFYMAQSFLLCVSEEDCNWFHNVYYMKLFFSSAYFMASQRTMARIIFQVKHFEGP